MTPSISCSYAFFIFLHHVSQTSSLFTLPILYPFLFNQTCWNIGNLPIPGTAISISHSCYDCNRTLALLSVSIISVELTTGFLLSTWLATQYLCTGNRGWAWKFQFELGNLTEFVVIILLDQRYYQIFWFSCFLLSIYL